jgi:hypothetical protein
MLADDLRFPLVSSPLSVEVLIIPRAGPSQARPTSVFEVTPGKAYGHAKADPFSQTNYRF